MENEQTKKAGPGGEKQPGLDKIQTNGERKRMRRFYKEARAEALSEGGYSILLDGRQVRTPRGRAPLVLPTRALAAAIAEEWRAQGDEIRPESMGLMALAVTALDRVAQERAGVIEALVKYAETDLLCYREDRQSALAARQREVWQPLLDWAALTFDAPLNVIVGLMPGSQPPEAVAAFRRRVESYEDMRLAALSSATQLSGSLIIGLALVEGRLGGEEAFEVAELDATYQIELWGEDHEARQRRETQKSELICCERFVGLLHG